MKSIKNYGQALEYLGEKVDRPYANNTRIHRLNLDRIGILYHGNCIVTLTPREIIFSSCGWKTITTKERLNWFLPDGFHLYQERSTWYLSDRSKGKRYAFADGLAIDTAGNVYNDAGDGAENDVKKTIKAIKKYVDGYIKALLSGDVPQPSGGDCWYCFMTTENGASLGDATKNTDHIMSHFEEEYYVPSLLYRAYDHNKRLSELAKDGVARLSTGEKISERQASLVSKDVKSCLTSYLKHVLSVAQ